MRKIPVSISLIIIMGKVGSVVVMTRSSILSLSVVKLCPACAMDLTRRQAEPPPQIRFILLLPTVHERITEKFFKQSELDLDKKEMNMEAKDKAAYDAKRLAETKEVWKKNELFDENKTDSADTKYLEEWRKDRMNISRDALFKILTKYDIAPGACSHIRGQEQIFGSRTTKNETNEVTAVGTWCQESARPYSCDQ